MDVTPIVEVLEAMPSGPTVNVTVEINPTIDGDLTLLRTGDWNAPFGRDFMDVTFERDQSTHNDYSTHVTGVKSDSAAESVEEGEEAAAEAKEPAFGSPSLQFPDSPSLPTFKA
ncbi:MAG: hypothetical protein Q4E11_09455 [Corynebacterium sp.]|uniref:hypothetical protein n=1 Tax=Corynebacterium sp. TaxID=1720 RepID=UPI0026DD3249|nr:hypothetical protein [Corynebacterium sp.]MDO5030786.1 hypothetical protein [Corynebacterium sp.]